jgi:Raf kinase inhibitor-like YbhB/YbcL family protein
MGTAMGGAAAPDPGAAGEFELMPVNFPMADGEWAFPASAKAGTDVSPAFSWTGVPADAKSLVLVFQDIGISAVKWVVWDIPPDVTMIPEGVGPSTAMLMEVEGASQLGSLGNQGYAGPARPDQRYEWTLWALNVDKLPDTQGKTTVDLLASLPMFEVARTEDVIVYNR